MIDDLLDQFDIAYQARDWDEVDRLSALIQALDPEEGADA